MAKHWYVTMTDKFMSDRGPAKGKIFKLVIKCDNIKEAEVVHKNAANMPGSAENIIYPHVPNYNSEKYVVAYGNKTTHKSWFRENAFLTINI
jgi:hypothetical protein